MFVAPSNVDSYNYFTDHAAVAELSAALLAGWIAVGQQGSNENV